ncbi:MAG: hypothetical protein Q9223_005813 [Gallowayella weberi]
MAAWSTPDNKDTGFINPGNYTNPDVICHKGATPGSLYATVAAGSTIQLQWSGWPDTHHGPVIDYLANCNGECTSVDKTKLRFNKIDGEGLLDWTAMPGNWASDKLKAAKDSWTVTIPSNVAPGNYVLRHEIIALHSADKSDGAQNYPQCVNLKVTGSGTDNLASGTLGTQLYKPSDAGIFVNIYQKLTTYSIPGPALYNGAASGTPTSGGHGSPTTTSSIETSLTTTYDGISPEETSSTAITPSSASLSIPTTTPPPYPTGSSNMTIPTFNPDGQKKAGVKKPDTTKTTAVQTPTSKSLLEAPKETGSSSNPPTTESTTDQSTPSKSAPGTNTQTEPEISPSLKHHLPSGISTQELLEWLNLIVAELQSRLGNKTRRHARDFLGLGLL